MKKTRNSSSFSKFVLLGCVIIFSVLFFTVCVEARKSHEKKNKSQKHGKQRNPGPAQPPIPCPNQSNVFNVMSFGARGDGVSDDSKALVAAWKAACNITGATIQIPSEYKFLTKPITLQGPCMPGLVLQIDGTLLAPPKIGSWPKSSLFQWINFKWVHNFIIQGTGIIDGQGSNWWTSSQIDHVQKRSKQVPDMKPTALRFYASYNVTVRDIKIINSPQCHLKFDNSGVVKINNVTISAPESSPNTDGIHLQNTQDVEIQHSNIGCGDDCVSIQTGCSNVHVHHINCGPGHGISIGGLGKDKSIACVSNILVENIFMQNTLFGARIKTWQGGMGAVKNVTFSKIEVTDVKVAIIIDQNYCDKKYNCKEESGGIAISDVKYEGIMGSYWVQPIHLGCSNDIPCTDVDLVDVQLNPSSKKYHQGFIQKPFCWNSYGKSQAPLVPSTMDYCLRTGPASLNTIAKSHYNICHKPSNI